jgi:hypothetical protein
MAIAPRPKSRVLLRPNAVYTLAGATEALGLSRSGLRREARAGRLRTAEVCGRLYATGRWLLGWVESREVRRNNRPGEAA